MRYVLNNGENDIATFTLSDKNDWFEGTLITHNAWIEDGSPYEAETSYMADLIIKWDGCSHWNFKGEDYAESGELDAYYHLCGSWGYKTHIACLWFAWKCAERFYAESDKWNHHFNENGGMDEFDPIFANYKITKHLK